MLIGSKLKNKPDARDALVTRFYFALYKKLKPIKTEVNLIKTINEARLPKSLRVITFLRISILKISYVSGNLEIS